MGLRELNQNPSRAVAIVRAGASLLVTDRGRPVLRMTPEGVESSALGQMVAAGEVRAPTESGMPDVVPDLAPDVASLSGLILDERNRDRAT